MFSFLIISNTFDTSFTMLSGRMVKLLTLIELIIELTKVQNSTCILYIKLLINLIIMGVIFSYSVRSLKLSWNSGSPFK